jgi:hypothetical protein
MAGFPFMSVLSRIVFDLFKADPDDDPEKLVKEALQDHPSVARAITRGIPSVMGNDMSYRIEGTDVFDIPVGFATMQTIYRRLKKGYSFLEEGDIKGALFLAAPDMFKNPYEALRGMEEGGERRGLPPIKYTEGEAAWKAMGFTPTREAETYKAVELTQKKRERRLAKLESYAERYLIARKEGDREALSALRDEVVTARKEEIAKGRAGVPINWKDVMKSAKLRGKAINKGYVEKVPKYMQRYQKQVQETMVSP